MIKHLKHKFLLLIAASLILSPAKAADDISVKATLDSLTMLIGHQSKLTLEISKPSDADIAFPMILDTIVDKVEVLSKGPIDTTYESADRQTLVQELLITSFDSGFYYIPPFEFEVMPNSGSGTIATNPLVLKMYTYQIDSIAGVFDIKDNKTIPLTFRETVPYILGFLLVLLIVAIIVAIYIFWIKKDKSIFIPQKPKEPPYVTAFRELERIRAEKLWQKGKEKEYFTDLTSTLRAYIEGRFQVLAMEQTSDEILQDMKAQVSQGHYKKIEDILKLADLVKFAKMRPMLDESERCIKEAYSFVDETKLVPESGEENEEKANVELKKDENSDLR